MLSYLWRFQMKNQKAKEKVAVINTSAIPQVIVRIKKAENLERKKNEGVKDNEAKTEDVKEAVEENEETKEQNLRVTDLKVNGTRRNLKVNQKMKDLVPNRRVELFPKQQFQQVKMIVTMANSILPVVMRVLVRVVKEKFRQDRKVDLDHDPNQEADLAPDRDQKAVQDPDHAHKVGRDQDLDPKVGQDRRVGQDLVQDRRVRQDLAQDRKAGQDLAQDRKVFHDQDHEALRDLNHVLNLNRRPDPNRDLLPEVDLNLFLDHDHLQDQGQDRGQRVGHEEAVHKKVVRGKVLLEVEVGVDLCLLKNQRVEIPQGRVHQIKVIRLRLPVQLDYIMNK